MIRKLGVVALLFTLLSVAACAANLQTVVINGQTMVSLRSFGDTFNAVIDYNDGRDDVAIAIGNRTVEMIPYARMAWIDGHEVTLDAPMVIIDDVAYVPIRFLCDAFGLDCDWDRQVVCIPRTEERVILVLDDGWSRQRHVWRYRYDCHDFSNFRIHISINLGGSARHEGWSEHVASPNSHDWHAGHETYARPPWTHDEDHGPVKPTISSIFGAHFNWHRSGNETQQNDWTRPDNNNGHAGAWNQQNNGSPSGATTQHGTLGGLFGWNRNTTGDQHNSPDRNRETEVRDSQSARRNDSHQSDQRKSTSDDRQHEQRQENSRDNASQDHHRGHRDN